MHVSELDSDMCVCYVHTIITEAEAALGFGVCLFFPLQLDNNKVSKPWVGFQYKNCILLFFRMKEHVLRLWVVV